MPFPKGKKILRVARSLKYAPPKAGTYRKIGKVMYSEGWFAPSKRVGKFGSYKALCGSVKSEQ